MSQARTGSPATAESSQRFVGARIALFIPSFERGGTERNVVNLARYMSDRDFDVDVVLTRADGAMLPQLPEGARLVWLGRSVVASIMRSMLFLAPPRVRVAASTVVGLVRYLRDQQPGVLISFQSSGAAIWASQLARVPTRIIVREASTPSAWLAAPTHWMARLIPIIKRRMYPKAHVIVANSKGAAQDLAETIGLPLDRVQAIYNPSANDRVLEMAKEPLEHKWFQDGQPPVVLGVGRLSSEKGFDMLVRAFALVRERTEARLVILGEGRQRAALEKLASDLGVARDLQMPGFVQNPYAYMARSAVFVLPSRVEGLPNALIEAVAVGVPVVAADCRSGPSEILLDGAGGPLVPVDDHDAMAEAVAGLLQDRGSANEFVARAQEGLYRFRPEVSFKHWLEIIEGQLKAAGQ